MKTTLLHVDQRLHIGVSMLVSPTDIDVKTVRLHARGVMIGGPDDGATFDKAQDLARGGQFPIGPHIVLTVLDLVGDAVRLGVLAPPRLVLAIDARQ